MRKYFLLALAALLTMSQFAHAGLLERLRARHASRHSTTVTTTAPKAPATPAPAPPVPAPNVTVPAPVVPPSK
jgi:hypothetical protein